MKKVLFFLLLGYGAMAQNATAVIKTSAVCGMCKQRIEKNISLSKGVKEANLDLDTKALTVVYNPKKTNVKELEQKVSNIGYDANEVVADKKSHDNLPSCCQKSATPHKD